MRALFLIAAAALALNPAYAFAQDDDGPIATAPEAGRTAHGPPPVDASQDAPAPRQPAPRFSALPPPAPPAPQQTTYAAPAPAPRQPVYMPPAPPPQQAYVAPAPAPRPASEAVMAPAPRSSSTYAAADGVAFESAAAPPFMAITPGRDAMAGPLSVVGAVAALRLEASDGAKLVAADSLVDPAGSVAQRLAGAVASARGAQVSADAGSARYLVRTETRNWGFEYYLFDWSHFRVIYVVRAELLDARSHKLLARADCTHQPDASAEKFALAQFTGDGGVTLKAQLAAAADGCASQLAARLAQS